MIDPAVVGDVFRVRNWDHCGNGISFKYGVGRKKIVALMLYLGSEMQDGKSPLNLELQMNRLGWYKK